jgi:hypothetical protein
VRLQVWVTSEDTRKSGEKPSVHADADSPSRALSELVGRLPAGFVCLNVVRGDVNRVPSILQQVPALNKCVAVVGQEFKMVIGMELSIERRIGFVRRQ